MRDNAVEMTPTGSFDSDSRGISLALGGGGARGLAHIGVLKVLDQAGIPIAAIAGTSMGAIVGALYLRGISPEEMAREAQQRSRFTEVIGLIDLSLGAPHGLLKGRRIEAFLSEKLGRGCIFSDLSRPFAAVAVDTFSGREVVLRHGLVANAVRASMAVPGVFYPIERENMRLVDGGVLNNVPADVARSLTDGPVVAIDVLPYFGDNEPGQPPVVVPPQPTGMPQPVQGLWHVVLIMMSELTARRLQEVQPELLLRPELPPRVDVLAGFASAAEVITAGERAAASALPAIQRLLVGQPED